MTLASTIGAELLPSAGLTALLSAALFATHTRDAVDADEGYLWYGALCTLDGDIPIRDFRSYEPGRYYWCALFMRLFGTGILPLRAAVHCFYFIGLGAGALALRISGLDWILVIAATSVLTMWAHPSHKLFEPALLLWAILAGALLIMHPGMATVLLAGVVVGLATFFGVNYGLYTGCSLAGLALLTGLRVSDVDSFSLAAGFGGGILTGLLPLLLMLVAIPGLPAAFYDRRVRTVFERRTTNLPLPIPWPWKPISHALSVLQPTGQRFAQFYFLLLPVFSWSTALSAWFAPWSQIQATPGLFAAAFVGAFSLHHAMSRADVAHLAQSMVPLILGLFVLFADNIAGWLILGTALGWGTIVTILPVHPWIVRRSKPESHVAMKVGATKLWMPKGRAILLDRIHALTLNRLEPGESLLALPTLIALYPILGLRAPVYDIFCVYPASPDDEERMLRSLEKSQIRLAVIADHPLDGRDDLRFSRTHPRVWAYLHTHLDPVSDEQLHNNYHIFSGQTASLSRDPRQGARQLG